MKADGKKLVAAAEPAAAPEVALSAPPPSPFEPMAPPTVSIPTAPRGFTPVDFKNFRGSFPVAGQVAQVPGVVKELRRSTKYAQVFGPAVPPAERIATELAFAVEWTTLRLKLDAFLLYVRSFEAMTWKSSLADLGKLDAIFRVVAKQNPVVLVDFPELTKLLDVPKVIGKRGAATRARKRKERALGAAS
jgi:hypothetical protein